MRSNILTRLLGLGGVVAAVLSTTSGAIGADRNNPNSVSLRSAIVDADRAAATTEAAPANDIQLVKFPGPVSAQQRAALASAVRQVFTYLPHHAFLVRLPASSQTFSATAVGALWSAPYLPEYKISPEMALTRASDGKLRPVMIHIFPDVDVAAAVAEIERLVGRQVEAATTATRFARARILLTGSEIANLREPLAARPEVFWLERESRRVFFNDDTVWVGQSGTDGGGATPVFDQGILGAGQIVGVLDTGIDIDSCYFADPAQTPAINECNGGTLINLDHRKVVAVDFLWDSECAGGINSSEWDTHDHGTHVAGTVAGDDFALPNQHNGRDGMAPQAKLVFQDCGYEYNVCADCPGIGCPVIDLNPVFEQPYNQGARIHTNSWGDEEEDPAFGEYTSGSEDADTVMWNHPDYLLVFAAGNNGGGSNTVDSPSTAKSVLSVGSTEHGAGANFISSFSSRGPTDDGRIKPSITIVGSSVMSANNDGSINTDNCDDQSMSGTSMAAPGAAGLAALVRQYYSDGWYPSGTGTPSDAFTPSAALLRASLVNSGEQMTGEGNIPNNTQGWGRILLDNVLYFAGDGRKLWLEDDTVGFASSGASLDYQINVASNLEPLEVTLAWTDYPSTPAASPNLVNDLDLSLSGPNGTFLGNVFSAGQSTTGGSADRLNTLENVLLTLPTPGLWTITVTSYAVPDGPQPFALVATGDIVACSGTGSARALAGTSTVSLAGGDGDAYLDNCEGATVDFSVANTGSTSANNVSIIAVSSPSHPGTTFASPSWSVPTMEGCSLDDTASIEITQAVGLAHSDTLLIAVEITHDEIFPNRNVTVLSIPATETDLTLIPLRAFDFESDYDGWSTSSGTFVRADAGGAASGSWYLQSSADLAWQCDVIESPAIELSPTSTLSLYTHYEIEGGMTWYDRANISIVDGTTRTVVEADGGRFYDVPDGSPNGTCGTADEAGWAGTNTSWAVSTFSASALAASGFSGRPVSFEVAYGTDGGIHLGGFRFDLLELTDIIQTAPDVQSDSCDSWPLFADGFESGDTTAWSTTHSNSPPPSSADG